MSLNIVGYLLKKNLIGMIYIFFSPQTSFQLNSLNAILNFFHILLFYKSAIFIFNNLLFENNSKRYPVNYIILIAIKFGFLDKGKVYGSGTNNEKMLLFVFDVTAPPPPTRCLSTLAEGPAPTSHPPPKNIIHLSTISEYR